MHKPTDRTAIDTDQCSDTVLSYHERTKHHFDRYAAGPPALDWDAQPMAFRHFSGSPTFALPLVNELLEDPSLNRLLQRRWSDSAAMPASFSREAIGALLNLALGITAWKQLGPDRWALRANPSSGNLHPIEGYLIATGIAAFADGLYHYDPQHHQLELRARFMDNHQDNDSKRLTNLFVGLSSAQWREAWKYGERAFRYCQLDVGHAEGALRIAADILGWQVVERRDLASDDLAALLGIDRDEDFPGNPSTEHEEPELLLQILCDADTQRLDIDTLLKFGINAQWCCTASTIDRNPQFHWPILETVAQASRHNSTEVVASPSFDTVRTEPFHEEKSIADVVLGRRSAQRFDSRHTMTLQQLRQLLAPLHPFAGNYWSGSAASITLLLFIHRVDGLAPGIYLLPRAQRHEDLRAAIPDELPLRDVAAMPELKILATLDSQQLKREARSLHCHQEIAASCCLAIGMLSSLTELVRRDPGSYRDQLRGAGMLGQMLYLQAERLELSGTGIGCYFDDAVHALVGLDIKRYQSLYHFTIGRSLQDSRIQTEPAYPPRIQL